MYRREYPFSASRFVAREEVKGDDSIEQPPKRHSVAFEIYPGTEFPFFYPVQENPLYYVCLEVGFFYQLAAYFVGEFQVIGVDHESHQDSEKLPVDQKELGIILTEFFQQVRCAQLIVQRCGDLLVKLVDVRKEYLDVNFLLALEIKVDGPFAQLRFPCYVVDSYRLVALVEKKLAGSFQYLVPPGQPLLVPSFLKSHCALLCLNRGQLLTASQLFHNKFSLSSKKREGLLCLPVDRKNFLNITMH